MGYGAFGVYGSGTVTESVLFRFGLFDVHF